MSLSLWQGSDCLRFKTLHISNSALRIHKMKAGVVDWRTDCSNPSNLDDPSDLSDLDSNSSSVSNNGQTDYILGFVDGPIKRSSDLKDFTISRLSGKPVRDGFFSPPDYKQASTNQEQKIKILLRIRNVREGVKFWWMLYLSLCGLCFFFAGGNLNGLDFFTISEEGDFEEWPRLFDLREVVVPDHTDILCEWSEGELW